MDGEKDTVQVQDTDFELVKPTLPLSPFGGSFESLPSPGLGSHLRADSPALSTLSGGSSLRHQGFGDASTSASASTSTPSPRDTRSPKETKESVEAHRQRELRWVSAISSIPASQARKSKKVRKMVLDGVPASVRYQVWATLTDSKGKRMDGLYQKLAQRDKVAAWPEIERDVREGFDGMPMARDGSLGKLLQVYLCMVPDIQYSRGLVMIAGQLLLQSPEEDAFWTFVSLMDTHLRPYFSNNSVQLEVDATLFARALENNDAASANKVFGDMDIPPVVVCKAWFTTVFADALPSEYLVRLWDVFLFEGVTFLFRAGLALFSCARRVFLQSTSPDAVLDALSRPPPGVLPPSPDAFIELAFSMKLKDDDIRKQRNKLEAQVKRRTAQTRASPISPATPQTISLPKNGI
ncbi:RabGAP/TBC [Lentinus tigrinus ALCF2SS1-7]|uniref:RabGAP/TBC n=1 Tax=Lentinus tigrinus ALCF2SS1-6 TaxID=1328759 RepID=A0A5C2RNK9_9APHY|nr:RabGAP/TBC [Lentinus tigrinus ALCF2SS1-6]RPD68341.1 RabGAP/TBC [Lentinus tigrinus ALCF2SS1-7]